MGKRDRQAQKAYDKKRNAARWQTIKADPELLAKHCATNKKTNERHRRELIQGYGGQCVCCGTKYHPHLTIDHVDGNGNTERREVSSPVLMRRLRREGCPPAYQVLCWNCNSAKHLLGRCGCSD